MSEMVPVLDAQRGATGRLRQESMTKGQHTPWTSYVRGLEATKQVSFVSTGRVLMKGKVYLDLFQPCRGPFRALQGQTAGSRNRYIAQEEVPATAWYALIEHCASVDSVTGAIASSVDVPSVKGGLARRRGAKRAFAA
jgi:hypothetical protein